MLKKRVAYRQKYRCALCNILLPPTYQVDHITPLFLGGSNHPTNLQALCPNCHADKTQTDFLHCPKTCPRCSRPISPYFIHQCHGKFRRRTMLQSGAGKSKENINARGIEARIPPSLDRKLQKTVRIKEGERKRKFQAKNKSRKAALHAEKTKDIRRWLQKPAPSAPKPNRLIPKG